MQKRYGDAIALDGLDLEVGGGELLAVLGPNGAGKSTAIALMLGLQMPDKGEVLLFGRSPRELSARRGVGVMMQEVALADALRVHDHIAMTAAYYPDPLTVAEAVALVGIEAIAGRPYAKLSGGQKKQAQFALSICGRPRLLFLDEPTTGLDLQAREAMWATLRRLAAAGTSIVLTTHYIEEAEALADRVAVVVKGRRIAEGTVQQMRASVSSKRISCITTITLTTIRSWPNVTGAHVENGRTSIITTDAEATARRLLTDTGLRDLEVRRGALSDAFAALIQEPAE